MSEKSEAERKESAANAKRALGLIDTVVQRDMHGGIDGIDTIDAGLRAMASALQKLFDIPVPEGITVVYLDDVLDYLAAAGRVDPGASRLTLALKKDLTDAMYHGLSEEAIEAANDRRAHLYDMLVDLLESKKQ